MMTARPKALIAWSSGKDSAWALHEMRRAGNFEIVGALTTVTRTFARVSMHGVREELLKAQLDAAGLPATIVYIPYPCPNDVYEREMGAALAAAKNVGVTHVVFGDLFLEDIRAYREKRLAEIGMTPIFPLWRRPTAALAREMIESKLEAHLVCVDLKAFRQHLRVAASTTTSSIACRLPSIHAARTESFIPLLQRGRCSTA
jgi:diphthamide synthase (EF-2-diphthine--ammonia ligase)